MIPNRAAVLNTKSKPSSKQINKTSPQIKCNAVQFKLDQAIEIL